MSRRYSAAGDQAVGSNATVLGVTSAATIRPKLYDVLVGCAVTPADEATNFVVQRYTAAGTATSVTPQGLDPGDPAALASAGSNHSGEPTYTSAAILLTIPLNQRATFRWVASPGGELVMPATAANGLGIYSLAATGSAEHRATFHWEE